MNKIIDLHSNESSSTESFLPFSFPGILEIVSDIYHIHRNDIPMLDRFLRNNFT